MCARITGTLKYKNVDFPKKIKGDFGGSYGDIIIFKSKGMCIEKLRYLLIKELDYYIVCIG